MMSRGITGVDKIFIGRFMEHDKKKVALVIGSGSVKCAAAIGMHKVLLREGIEVR